ncbi:MAG: SRPBCC family protein [Actinomycetota bacterium]|nr:SRPBCC family protein [Actinomycetota bacterium]MDQ2957003.1 SRPBCC family protein [Actinomycetota bacterium]
MWTTEYTLTTDVSPEALWQLLSDVDGWGAWNDGIETIALDGPLAVGTTFRMKPPGEDALTSTIVELEPNRLLTDVTELGELAIRVVHRLEPVAGGGTSITYRVEASGPAGEEVGKAVSADFPQVIAALAAAASTAGAR